MMTNTEAQGKTPGLSEVVTDPNNLTSNVPQAETESPVWVRVQ